MICEKCGAENPDGSTFCQKCGAQLAEASAPKTKSESKSKSRTKSKRSTASSKGESKTSTSKNTGGWWEMLKGLPVQMALIIGGITALAIALLAGILDAAGAGDFVEGSAKAAMFFDHLVSGILVAGVLIGLSALISKE